MFNVRVINENGDSFWIETRGDETIEVFRKKIWQKSGVPWSGLGRCQILSSRGRSFSTLQDYQTLNPTIGLGNGDVIRLAEDKTALLGGDNRTYLHLAADGGMKEAVRLLTERFGVTTLLNTLDDEVDKYDCTALHHATSWGHSDVAEDLVGLGMNCEATNKDGCTPLYLACIRGNTATIRALECGGADVNNSSKRPLHRAASYGNIGAVSELVEGGAECPLVWNRFVYPDLLEALVTAGGGVRGVRVGPYCDDDILVNIIQMAG